MTREEWQDWLKKTHADKGDKGDKWLASLLHTLSTNLHLNTIKVRVADQRAELIFDQMAGKDGLLSKEELVEAFALGRFPALPDLNPDGRLIMEISRYLSP